MATAQWNQLRNIALDKSPGSPWCLNEESLQIIASGVRVNLANSCTDFPTMARLYCRELSQQTNNLAVDA